MSDPLAGPIQAGHPVKRLNKLPLILLASVVAVALFLTVTSISQMNNRNLGNADHGTKSTIPTQSYVEKWLADKPNGVIGEAYAEELEVQVVEVEAPVEVPEYVMPSSTDVAPITEDPTIALQAKHGEAIEKIILAERQRILENQMTRKQMAIKSPVAVSFTPKMEEDETNVSVAPTDATSPESAIIDMMASMQSGGGAGGNPLANFGVGGDSHADEVWRHLDHKNGFIQSNGGVDNYLDKSRNAALGKTEIKAGTTIPAVMITGVNSDLPGQMLAQVSSNVWDSIDGSHVLIPQGARLIGRYDSAVQYAQNRLLVVWDRLIFPDGSSLDLESMQGHDRSGSSGFKDKVDNHFGRIFGSALLMSAITAGIETTVEVEVGTDGEIFRSEVADQLGEVATEMLRKNLNISPTIEIRAGYRFGVMVNKDIILPPYRPMQTAIRKLSQ